MTSHEIFILTALVATGIFLLQFVISVFFGDLDMDVDGDANADFDLGSLFSFKGLVHFLIGFGWTRVLFDGDTWQMYALAVLVGVVLGRITRHFSGWRDALMEEVNRNALGKNAG